MCSCYIAGSLTLVAGTFVTALDRFGQAGTEALFPFTVGWSIAGLPVMFVAPRARDGLGVLACAVICLVFGFLASMPRLT